MSGDSQLAARIAELTEALAAANAQLATVVKRVSAAEAARDQATAQLAETQTTLSAEREQHQRDMARSTAALAEANAGAAKARADYAAVTGRLTTAQQARVDRAEARVAELEALCLSDPPAGSGIDKVQRYRTSDGAKHKTLPDAQAHARRLVNAARVRDAGVPEPWASKVADMLN